VDFINPNWNILPINFSVNLRHDLVNVLLASLYFFLVFLSIVFVPNLNHPFENANFTLVVQTPTVRLLFSEKLEERFRQTRLLTSKYFNTIEQVLLKRWATFKFFLIVSAVVHPCFFTASL
jgi:hypothetical protein